MEEGLTGWRDVGCSVSVRQFVFIGHGSVGPLPTRDVTDIFGAAPRENGLARSNRILDEGERVCPGVGSPVDEVLVNSLEILLWADGIVDGIAVHLKNVEQTRLRRIYV